MFWFWLIAIVFLLTCSWTVINQIIIRYYIVKVLNPEWMCWVLNTEVCSERKMLCTGRFLAVGRLNCTFVYDRFHRRRYKNHDKYSRDRNKLQLYMIFTQILATKQLYGKNLMSMVLILWTTECVVCVIRVLQVLLVLLGSVGEQVVRGLMGNPGRPDPLDHLDYM